MEDEDEVPRSALNITAKVVSRSVKSLCFIRSMDEMGMAVGYPGGTTGYVKIDQVSNKINEDIKAGGDVDLSDYYSVGETVLTSLSAKRKKNKLHLSVKPEFINQHFRTDQIRKGQNLQGTILSQEDTGWIIDIGKDNSKVIMIW